MEATIELLRDDNQKLTQVNCILPVWIRQKSDFIDILLPTIGIETFCEFENEIEEAVEEATKAFFLISEDFGLGLEDELKFFGWKSDEEDNNVFDLVEESKLSSLLGAADSQSMELELDNLMAV